MGEAARKKAAGKEQAAQAAAAGEPVVVEVSEATRQRLVNLDGRRALFREVMGPSLKVLRDAEQAYDSAVQTVVEAHGIDLARASHIEAQLQNLRLVVHFPPQPAAPDNTEPLPDPGAGGDVPNAPGDESTAANATDRCPPAAE